jgi:hypothetical protein
MLLRHPSLAEVIKKTAAARKKKKDTPDDPAVVTATASATAALEPVLDDLDAALLKFGSLSFGSPTFVRRTDPKGDSHLIRAEFKVFSKIPEVR